MYNVNFDYVVPKRDKLVPNFKSVLSRKQPLPPIYTCDEQSYLYRSTMAIKQSLARERKGESRFLLY